MVASRRKTKIRKGEYERNITKKRYLALLLAVVMIFSTIMPNMVFAAGSNTIVYGPEDCTLSGGANVQTDASRGT